MASEVNILLSLILIALGFLGVILSFLVPDRKKSFISLGLAGLIIITGLYRWGSQGFSKYRYGRQLREFQKDRMIDLEKLRELKNQVPQGAATPGASQKK